MPGETALDSTTAIRYLNGDRDVIKKVLALPKIVLPLIVVGELLFGAENSSRSLENYSRYLQFINTCTVIPMGKETCIFYSRTRCSLKQRGRPIPDNDIWIASQCLEHKWKLITDDEHFKYVDDLAIESW
jgi:tRNA(fMet)-specific endonuclease VapC